jgi:cell division septation protein DedD
MDSRLKQRLVGAAVLVALAVIFLPMLVQGPAPDSGVSDVPLSMPDAPRADYETRDLPLVAPGNTPDGGAVGMQSAPPAAASVAAATQPAPSATTSTASVAIASVPASTATPATAPASKPPAASEAALPATTAGGDYAVSFGTYATTGAADAVIASLRASQLPGYRETAIANGKPAWRVRIGPYASRAEAEIARLRASHVRDDAGARVVTLDAPATSPSPAVATSPAKTTPSVVAAPSKPTNTTPATATGTGFALQLAAFSKPADATALRDKLRAAGFSAFTESVATDKGALTRVRVGPVITRAEADQLKSQVKAKLGLDGIVRPHP